MFQNRYDGPVYQSRSWTAKNPSKDPIKAGDVEHKMLTLLKKDYGLSTFEDPENGDDGNLKAKIQNWINERRSVRVNRFIV